MNPFNSFTSALGAGLVVYVSYKLLDAARLYTRPSSLHRYLYTDASGQRAWALVTGSSDGIGKCLAFELAGHGFNVVLHGRNADKLGAVRDELRAASPGAEVRVLVADASQCHRRDAVDFERIGDELASLHLTVLVNCVGAGPTPAFGALEAYGRDDILDNLHLNAAFPTLLTAALLPVLRGRRRKRDDAKRWQNGHLARGGGGGGEDVPATTAEEELSRTKSRGRGQRRGKPAALVINIGSVTDDGFPLVSFYSAGKAASHALHRALAREVALDDRGNADDEVEIEIVSHRVGAVTGVTHTRAPPTLFRPHARTVASAVLARAGCGRKSVVPYWPHALMQCVLAALPASVSDRVINAAMRKERRGQDEKTTKT